MVNSCGTGKQVKEFKNSDSLYTSALVDLSGSEAILAK